MQEMFSKIVAEGSVGLMNLLILAFAALAGFLFSYVILKAIKLFFINTGLSASLLNRNLRFSIQMLMSVAGLNMGMAFTTYKGSAEAYVHKILYILLILSFAHVLIRITHFIKELLYLRFDIKAADNLIERKARTQIDFLQKLASIIIMLVAVSIAIMSFSRVRELGASILASAGIAGILIGLAAQKSISNLLAGFQIAFTQPIRLDDVVIVENEWGRIEEITLTYVVVRIWDMRRLIVPISHFLEKPFQNWTRVSAEILGTVFIYTDYTVPIDEVRKELKRILAHEGKAYWDGKVGLIQVTNTSEKGIELRVLVSATDAGLAWDLRCLLREQLIVFIQKNYPESLPRIRLSQDVPVVQS